MLRLKLIFHNGSGREKWQPFQMNLLIQKGNILDDGVNIFMSHSFIGPVCFCWSHELFVAVNNYMTMNWTRLHSVGHSNHFSNFKVLSAEFFHLMHIIKCIKCKTRRGRTSSFLDLSEMVSRFGASRLNQNLFRTPSYGSADDSVLYALSVLT